MTFGGLSDGRTSKNQRREVAREKAKMLRMEQKKKDRRNRVFLRGGIFVVAIAVVALVVLVISNSIRPSGPGPANMASDGLVVGEGMNAVKTQALRPDSKPKASKPDGSGRVANIRIYVDYLCPFCGKFETTNGKQIGTWIDSGAATVEIHPVAILTSKSDGTQYSLRAANAAACVANYSPNDFYDFNSAMFQNQPEEGSAGRNDAALKRVVRGAGVSENLAKVDSCIDETTYKSWVIAATDRALAGPIPNSPLKAITGTPTVLVNGKQYVGAFDDPKEFSAFLIQAQYSDPETTSTPSPTPEPAPAG